MEDNVSKGQHSMSANNRSQGLMTVVAAADLCCSTTFLAILCLDLCDFLHFFVVFICRKAVLRCQQPPVKNTSATHAGGSVNRNKTKGVKVIHSQDGITAWAQPLKSVKTVLKRWLNHNLTAADLDLMYVCVYVCVCVWARMSVCVCVLWWEVILISAANTKY